MSHEPTEVPDARVRASGTAVPLVAGVVLVLLAAVMLREAFSVEVGRDLVRGPRLFPAVITVVFAVLAVAYLVQQVVALVRRSDTGVEGLGDVPKVVAMVVLLVVYGLVLEPLGYVLSTFVLFVAGSFLLGSRAWKRDLVVGVCLSLGIYLVFTRGLAVHLPQGVIPLG